MDKIPPHLTAEADQLDAAQRERGPEIAQMMEAIEAKGPAPEDDSDLDWLAE